LVTDKLIRKESDSRRDHPQNGSSAARKSWPFGLLFRLQEFLIAWGWAPWSDLLRVDVLNIIGLSMILMALTCGMVLAICRKARGQERLAGGPYQGMQFGSQAVENDRGL
jgi:hypothetical protein